jgi:hypothetical protein
LQEGLLECKTFAVESSFVPNVSNINPAFLSSGSKNEYQIFWVYVGHGRIHFSSFEIDQKKKKELNLVTISSLRNYIQLNRPIFNV